MYYKNIRLGKVALDGNVKFFALKRYLDIFGESNFIDRPKE